MSLAEIDMDEKSSPSRSERYRERKKRRKLRNWRYWQRHKKRLTEKRRQVAIRSYEGLANALAFRRNQLGLSQLELDDRCGFADGHIGKLEKPLSSFGRVATTVTMERWLAGLGVGLLVVPLTEGPMREQIAALAGVRMEPLKSELDHRRRIPE